MLSELSMSLEWSRAQLLPSDVQTTAEPVPVLMPGLLGSGKSRLDWLLVRRVQAVSIVSEYWERAYLAPQGRGAVITLRKARRT